MKGLILKDLYNISHNIKAFLFTIIFIAICMIPSAGTTGFGVTVTLICSMMTMTTFSMDERSNWMKYALIMPISRKEYVKSKFIVNLIFTVFGMILGGIIGMIGVMVKGSQDFVIDLITTGACCIVGLLLGIFYGSIMIPLIIKWGAEKARMIAVIAVAIPSLIAFLVYQLIVSLGITLTEIYIVAGIVLVVIVIVLLNVVSFRMSVKWLKEKEF